VRWTAALVGSLLAAVLWVIAKWAFEMYVVMAMPYSELYGSLALVPLFLFWLYMIWWIVLMGLEVVAFRQSRLEGARDTA
jgi:membrane protein